MSLPLLLITGASGYLGGHIIHLALESNYPIRITARPEKVEILRKRYGNKIEVFGVADLTTGDYTQALKGVNAVIHAASPLVGKEAPESMINSAVNGTRNILSQAVAAGVKNIIVTSSFASIITVGSPDLYDASHVLSANDWNPATKEEALDGKHDPFFVYCASKKFAEEEVWKVADEHPEIEMATILAPFFYGPYAPEHKGDYNSGTPSIFRAQVLPKEPGKLGSSIVGPWTSDVRDVANAHILALSAPPTSKAGRKRLLVAGTNFTWKDAVEYLQVARPELKNRLPDSSETPKVDICTTDTKRAQEVLGIDSFIDWKKTVEDTVDDILRYEKDVEGRYIA